MNYQEKFELANNPNTPADVLFELSMDEDYYVRCWVATHLNTPVEAFINMSTDEEFGVRFWVERNPNTPEYIKNYLKAKAYCGRFKN